MKLYDIPRRSKIKIGDVIVTLDHLDGAYSYCTIDGLEENNVVHLSRGTPLKHCGGYYEIIDEGNDEEKRPS